MIWAIKLDEVTSYPVSLTKEIEGTKKLPPSICTKIRATSISLFSIVVKTLNSPYDMF
jgi:hypothetical protein